MADDVLNYCHRGGQLVGPRFPIPEPPCDFVWDSGDAFFGCSNLVDSKGRKVRQRIDGDVRVYSCGSESDDISGRQWVEDPRRADLGVVIPWACGGHERLEPPFELDEEEIGADTVWNTLIRGVVDGTRAVSRPDYANRHAVGWLQRLYHLLAHTDLSTTLSEAIADMALESSPTFQPAGWLFFSYLSKAPGIDRLLTWSLTAKDDDLKQKDSRVSLLTLGSLVQTAVASNLLAGGGKIAVAAGRRMVMEEGKGAPPLVEALASADADWLLEHAVDLVKKHPKPAVLGTLIRLQHPALGAALPLWLHELLRDTGLARELFVMAVNDCLYGDDRDAAIAALSRE